MTDRSRNANLPNTITIIRIALAPLFVWLLLADAGAAGGLRYAAASLFVLAIATDGIDGYLARKNGQVTNLGKILDPIADKVLTGSALICLSIISELPWWVTAIILVREIGITLYRFAVVKKRVIPASRGGKLKTFFQAIALSLALFPLTALWGDWVNIVNTVVMSVACGLTVLTGFSYLREDWQLNRKKPSGEES